MLVSSSITVKPQRADRLKEVLLLQRLFCVSLYVAGTVDCSRLTNYKPNLINPYCHLGQANSIIPVNMCFCAHSATFIFIIIIQLTLK